MLAFLKHAVGWDDPALAVEFGYGNIDCHLLHCSQSPGDSPTSVKTSLKLNCLDAFLLRNFGIVAEEERISLSGGYIWGIGLHHLWQGYKAGLFSYLSLDLAPVLHCLLEWWPALLLISEGWFGQDLSDPDLQVLLFITGQIRQGPCALLCLLPKDPPETSKQGSLWFLATWMEQMF